jgi:protein TonB
MNIIAIAGVLSAALALSPQASQSAARGHLEDARAQYAAAAYEQALETLGRAAALPDTDRVELEQYRALCYIGLGQTTAAADAFTALVEADPTYDLPSSVASPKVRSLFGEVRAKQLPGTVRDLLANGREAYEAGTLAPAREAFALAARLLNDPALADWPDRETVLVLAEGFTSLADAAERQASEESSGATRSTGAESVQTDAAAADAPALPAAGAPGMANGQGGAEAPAAAVLPPVPVLQTMPTWVPPDAIARSRAYRGVLKVQIGEDGRVTSASIEEPSHPAYDVRLIHAARQWVFRPATRNGRPVASEKIIAVQLHPEG